MIKLTWVTKELLEEIIEKLGSFAIVDCEVNDTKFEDGEKAFYDIKFDSTYVIVVFHRDSLSIIKADRSIVIKNTRFYQCLIQ